MIGRRERGDTLVEVLIAIAILSMAVVAAQAVMSHGQSIALRAAERTTVQGTVNSQFSYLRYARDEYISQPASAGGQMWSRIVSNYAISGSSTAQVCDTNPANRYPYREDGMFYINETAALSATAPAAFANAATTYPLVGSPQRPQSAIDIPSPGKGVWLVARKGGSPPTEYIDFYAKACWTSLAGPAMEQLTSVMRLYVGSDEIATTPTFISPITFACVDEPTDIVLALDYSSSMVNGTFDTGVTRSEKMKQLSEEFIDTTIGFYGHNRGGFVPFKGTATIASAIGSSSSELVDAIWSTTNQYGTNLVDALDKTRLAFEAAPGGDDRARALIVVTDGQIYEEGQGPASRDRATQLKGSPLNVAIYTIGIVVSGTNAGLLNDIAGNGGSYFSADNQSAFELAMQEIAGDFACTVTA